MTTQKNKTLSTITLVLLIALAATIITLPATNAAIVIRTPYVVYAYVSAVPNPIGVGQTAIVTFRVDQPLTGASVRSGLANGTTIIITKPDGTIETKGPFTLDSTSSGWTTYTPTQVGTYYFQMRFPQQVYWINTTTTQTLCTYNAAESAKVSLTVQADPVQGYNRSPPLPTGYWTRPINAENKGWWAIADDWLMLGYDKYSRSFAGATAFSPYTTAPDSSHVLYTKTIIPGGIAGGQFGDTSYYTGISYEQFFTALVLQGTVIFNEHGLTSTTNIGTRFFNLYTGEDYPLMYMTDGTTFSFAQKLNTNSPNEHGVVSYLVQTSTNDWNFYEILPNMQQNPVLRFTLTNMSGLTNTNAFTFGPNGEILSFTMDGNATHRWIAMFNSTRAVIGTGTGDTWGPSGTINAKATPSAAIQAKSHSPYWGIEWNVTVPDVPGVTQVIGTSFAAAGTGLLNYAEGYLLTGAVDSTGFPLVYSDVGYDIGQVLRNRASDGTYPSSIGHLFAENRTMINDIHNRVSTNILDGKYVRFDEGREIFYCFDMTTGRLHWQSEPIGNAWAVFTRCYQLAYGKLVASSFDGHVYCYDLDTGDLLWDFYKGSAGFENAYGAYPEYSGFVVADGVLYCTADEHSSDGVLWRGSSLWAVDINTGEQLWKLNGMYRHPIAVDGILIALNSYDGQVYAFGKGPSKTTVDAPQTVVPLGTGVVLTGTVTDQTPVTKDTPAISDADMDQWMEYMHMQKVMPQNAQGVEVTLTAIDPNGNLQEIGTTTTNIAGSYGISWVPPVEGAYTVTATFAGSGSYAGSYDMTYFVVGPAPAAPQPTATTEPTVVPTHSPTVAPTASPSMVPEPEAQPSADIYIIAAAAAVIIVVVAAAAVFLRKRK